GDFLEMRDVRTGRANDAQAALSLLKEQTFDAIVSDIRMPGMDGLQFYEQARALEPHYGEHFIFMSGDLVRGSTRSFIQASGCLSLEKPFNFDTLYRHLEVHLPQKNGTKVKGR